MTRVQLRPASRIRSLVFSFAIVIFVAPAALAAWTDPETLSPAAQNAVEPDVAMDADGDAVAMWRRSDGTNARIQTRARSAAGALSPVQTLSAAGEDAFGSQVAVDDDGDAVFVWYRSDGTNTRIQARSRAATGTLSAIQTLSAAGQNASFPQVGVDANGDAVFVWRRFDGSDFRIQTRARSTTGTLSAIQTLSEAGQDADSPQVAVDADGDAVFVWLRSDGTNNRIQVRARAATGTLSPVQTLSAAGQNASVPQVEVDADGDAVAVWNRFDGSKFRIQARARAATGTLSAIQTLSAAGESAFDPHVGVDQDGDATFVWRRFDFDIFRIQARARSATGTLSAIQTLSTADEAAFNPQVAVDQDGDAVFVWDRFDEPNQRIEARARAATGTLSAVEFLSPAGQNAGIPQVGVDADGDAVAVWSLFDGTYNEIQGAAGP